MMKIKIKKMEVRDVEDEYAVADNACFVSVFVSNQSFICCAGFTGRIQHIYNPHTSVCRVCVNVCDLMAH